MFGDFRQEIDFDSSGLSPSTQSMFSNSSFGMFCYVTFALISKYEWIFGISSIQTNHSDVIFSGMYCAEINSLRLSDADMH